MDMSIELPHEWSATKRNHTQSGLATGRGAHLPGDGAEETPSSAAGGKLHHTEPPGNRRHNQGANGKGPTQHLPPAKGATDKQNSTLIVPAEEDSGTTENELTTKRLRAERREAMQMEDASSTEPLLIVKPSPLGPRPLFNPIMHDAPEKGQLRQMVLTQLGKKKGKGASTTVTAAAAGHPRAGQGKTDTRNPLEVHCLLSQVPYQKMLSDLFMHQDREILPSPNIPYVTRTYEESFMREPLHGSERLCAKQENCECMFLDKEHPFVAVEFLLPGEKPPATPHLCVVCCRAVTQQLYYDIMFDKQDFGGVIQRFGNIHSQPGEYALDAMLIAAPNVALHIMPLPIVSHQRNRYSVVIKRGIKHLKQSRVYFQCTPSC